MAGGQGLWRIWTMNLVGADKFGRWSPEAINTIGGNLEKLFQEVLKQPSCPYTTVNWFPAHLSFEIDPGEVLVHFVTRVSSICRARGAPALGPSGTTFPHGTGMISEVYVDRFLANGDYLTQAANLVFHEAMHNKIDVFTGKETNIHDTDGTGLATGGEISGSTPLTLRNKQTLGANMARVVPQHLGGVRQNQMIVDGMIAMIEGRDAPRP